MCNRPEYYTRNPTRFTVPHDNVEQWKFQGDTHISNWFWPTHANRQQIYRLLYVAKDSLILNTKENFYGKNNQGKLYPPDETLTKSAVAADAKAVGDALNSKADKSNTVCCVNMDGTKSYMLSIPNTGDNSRTMKITLSSAEQFVFIIAGSSLGNCFASFVGGSNFTNKHLLNTMTASTNGNVTNVTIPSWFRGTLISYMPFSVEIQ